MDEAQIIKQAQTGSMAAFNQLIMAYQGTAYNVAYRITGNQEAAADACQDAFLKAYNAINQHRGGSFKSWLMRIVTNACYDHLRYKSRRPADSLEEITENPGPDSVKLVSDQERPEEHVLRDELNDLLQFAINQLPEAQRVVLVLNDVQGFSYQEIADIIDQPLGTVKSRLSRARRRLRDYLLEQQELLPGQYRLNL
jgi:RNA polymerase sigma-70 factor (ECF subfamily)